MLEHLEVRGLGIIERVRLELPPGFVVLTGETGAGKSLLVESLKFLSGQRAQSDLVRTGDERLLVEGVFAPADAGSVAWLLGELGIEDQGSLVLRRELSAGGRGRCWVNDVVVTAGALQRLAPSLMAIHGQHESHGLGDGAVQRALVDDFADHRELLDRTRRAYAGWRLAADEVDRLEAARSRRRDRLDVIAFQLAEIDAVAPSSGEDDDLRGRRQVLRHAVRLLELSGSLLDGLSEGDAAVVDRLVRAERELEEMVSFGVGLAESVARLGEARVLVEEVVRAVQDLGGSIDQDPDELEAVESRLYRLEQLMLKYGGTPDAVLEHRDGLVLERGELTGVEESLDAARGVAAARLQEYAAAAIELDASRRSAGDELARRVEAVLERLNMTGTRLDFRWQCVEDAASPLDRNRRRVAFSAEGVEECELFFAANPGEEPRPMARVASGGELSRLHLGIRTVLRGRLGDGHRTLLFDEVDSGLGGATASALAGLLADLAAQDQVLVVTHLPQVAARAGAHFRIDKVASAGRAVTRVSRLTGGEREQEIARMLAGERISGSAMAHARDLLGTP